MATTKMWAIKKRIDHVINYATNEEKTKNKNYLDRQHSDLHSLLSYATNSDKTEKQFYVTGINCEVETALIEMEENKKYYNKTGGRLAYHGYQSFAPKEVTPKQAHDIGVKLAEELWGDRFQVVVSTHLNTNCYHNHFVLNSVSFSDGKKYCNTREDYAMFRETSDMICEEFGLKILDKTRNGKCNINYSNFANSYIAKSDYYINAKEDIDYAIKQAYTYDDFTRILKTMGYQLNYNHGCTLKSIRKDPYKRFIRIERNFGKEYSPANIKTRIMSSEPTRIPYPFSTTKNKYYKSHTTIKNKKKVKGIRALYLYYCYLLKVFPKKNLQRKLSPEMRAEVRKMEHYSIEISFLSKNHINTKKELNSYKSNIYEQLSNNLRNREKLWKRRTRAKTVDEKELITEEINKLSNTIKSLRNEIKLCESIETRTPIMVRNIKNMEEQNNIKTRKAPNKNIYVR